ncbi:protein root UVB sensitive 1, chloroplastic isoform X2 [Manihot esculenta]|uniref:Uncharacterized protein n=1 Tax=Manihot esculenta TaxID=3983 RepID=A0A251JUC7_MANES|nr:protein root UVB sensitive 1, chloroplastic isoform X2 [Manihot esculenta]OAY37319.1 hypothetical protein MANES_11G092600v8 [Manihot esculenta]
MGCSCSPLFLGRCWTSTSININLQTGSMLCFNASLETNASCNKELTITQRKPSPFDFPLGSGGSWNNNNNNNNNPIDPWWWNDGSDSSESHFPFICFLCCSVVFWVFINLHLASSALAKATLSPEEEEVVDEKVWEIKGSKWIRLIPDFFKDEFLVAPSSSGPSHDNRSPSWLSIGGNLWLQCRALFIQLMLPEGFPLSVTSDYLDYSLWRGIQGVASQISGVLATQALLYAVGLGKGAIPTAAAINWVLKDGIGYLSKIILSKYGRHFDVNPKGWRLFADLLENAAFGLEILTPAFPHLFVVIGAAAGAGRSAAALIQAATRSCFYAGFAAQRNFAEVIAKGEAQGMVSKFIGIMLGIALANGIGSSTPLTLASFSVVTWIHMFCNLKSYQSIQLRTLNPYRASLVFSEYLLSGQAPPIKEVNDEEPLFPALPFLNVNCKDKPQSAVLSSGARDAAAEIENRLQLGSKLSDIVKNKDEVLALFNLYRDEGYILTEHKGRFCVVLKESCSGQDMLKAVFQVNYLYWLERNAGIEARGTCADCRPGGRLQISLEYTQWEFTHVKNDSVSMGWVADGLIARPLPNRIGPGDMAPSIAT